MRDAWLWQQMRLEVLRVDQVLHWAHGGQLVVQQDVGDAEGEADRRPHVDSLQRYKQGDE